MDEVSGAVLAGAVIVLAFWCLFQHLEIARLESWMTMSSRLQIDTTDSILKHLKRLEDRVGEVDEEAKEEFTDDDLSV